MQNKITFLAKISKPEKLFLSSALNNMDKLTRQYHRTSFPLHSELALKVPHHVAKINMEKLLKEFFFLFNFGDSEFTFPFFFIMMLSLCRSPMPRTYMATVYPLQDIRKFSSTFSMWPLSPAWRCSQLRIRFCLKAQVALFIQMERSPVTSRQLSDIWILHTVSASCTRGVNGYSLMFSQYLAC